MDDEKDPDAMPEDDVAEKPAADADEEAKDGEDK